MTARWQWAETATTQGLHHLCLLPATQGTIPTACGQRLHVHDFPAALVADMYGIPGKPYRHNDGIPCPDCSAVEPLTQEPTRSPDRQQNREDTP